MCFPSGLSNPCAVQVLLSRNSEFAEPPATVQSSKKMVYQVFDIFRPFVSAMSWLSNPYIYTKRLCRACQPYRVKRAVQPLCFAGLSNPYFYTKRMCRACQPYHVKRAVQPFFCAGLSNPNLARPPRFFYRCLLYFRKLLFPDPNT